MKTRSWYPDLPQMERHRHLCDVADGCALVVREDGRQSPFLSFDSFDRFVRYYERLTHKRHHEIIRGKQKPHFDIDIVGTTDPDEVLDRFFDALCRALAVRGIDEDAILVFTSSDEVKHSYHVIVDGWYCDDYRVMTAFYDEVVGGSLFAEHIDRLYKKTHSLRILGSVKKGTQRVKEACQDSTLLQSLVTYTVGCRRLEVDVPPPTIDDPVDLSKDVVEQIVFLLSRREKGNFTVRRVQGSLVYLDRRRPSFCAVCRRVHESENAYVVVDDGLIYFRCHRDTSRYVIWGTIRIEQQDGGILALLDSMATIDKRSRQMIKSIREI